MIQFLIRSVDPIYSRQQIAEACLLSTEIRRQLVSSPRDSSIFHEWIIESRCQLSIYCVNISNVKLNGE